ncbi:erythromycin esterase family protein [Niabella drilacis]|uniref:Erythromycin esterase homolog n=1 Tax=Niabella drilacis (strain DSM 25811 / CCM 8410 / CCUG 62505 / LMG 26954 / E90) TaxID=1285928 RepID=A0A1G6T0I5_NIADE|nr:erythromycin esterase family protein [Niabella drilacis]SDD22543.1 Erythromycin esterase homolog [Niabella drilacis]
MKKYYLLLMLFPICLPGLTQLNMKEVVQALDKAAYPVKTLEQEGDPEDLACLKTMIGSARVIGLGESTHGTAAFNQCKRRMLRFLVSEMKVKAIVDEGDLLAAEKLDDYINGRADTIDYIGGVRPMLSNRELLQWLRNFNKDKTEADRVHIYGAEVRGFYGIIKKIQPLMAFTEDEKKVLDRFAGDAGVGYKNLAKADFEDLKPVAKKLAAGCPTAACRYYGALLEQQIDVAYRYRFGKNDFEVRDHYMFENIRRIAAQVPDGKLVINAHNGHLQKTKFMAITSLGVLLNSFFKQEYFVVATDFGEGNVSVYSEKHQGFTDQYFGPVADKNAVEFYFKQCRYPDFMVSTREGGAALGTLMQKKMFMKRNMGATGVVIKSRIRMADNYDLIVFLRQTR